ncbi:ribonuclease P protein component 4 [Halobaculum sp. D14]|uniref:ribonuclease P protein component 4 n=1 Tax=unclassified Halobaculum TaxID=2640896 RepID=UPI003EBD7455
MADIAEERIDRLAELSREAVKGGEPERAKEYVRLARRLAERHRCGVPRRFERFTCDRCDAFLVPGRNCRVRLQEGSHVVIRCGCGATARYPYRPERSA